MEWNLHSAITIQEVKEMVAYYHSSDVAGFMAL